METVAIFSAWLPSSRASYSEGFTMIRRRLLVSFATVALCGKVVLATSSPAVAQSSYPRETIRLIAPFGTGGLTDTFSRGLAAEMGKRLGTTVIIENRPGAFALNGTTQCANAKPDGYTICMLSSDAVSFAPHMRKQMPFDPDKDIAPIAQALYVSQALVVNKSLSVTSIHEFIELARKTSNGLHYANSSTAQVLAMTKLARDNNFLLISVTFKSGGEATSAVVNGDVKIGMFGVGNVAPFVADGSVRAIAIHGPDRPALLPNVPTLAEQGFPIAGQGWIGLAAPGGTPEPILDKLYAAATATMKDSEFVKRFYDGLGLQPRYMTRQEFTDFMKRDRKESGELVKLAGIEPQ